MVVNCEICNNEFKKVTNKKYCSVKCSKIAFEKIKKIYRIEKREFVLKLSKIYRENNREKMKLWKKNNRDKINIKNKEWINNNKSKKKQYDLKYRNKNRKKLNKWFREYKVRNINHKIACNLRTRVSASIKFNFKSKHTKELLGCSIEYLKGYLSTKFTEGMTWENYGKWHIDHIIPCSHFDLSDTEQQKICFHYTNLQPLWAIDNIKKGNKILINDKTY